MHVNISSPCPDQVDDYVPRENDGYTQADEFFEKRLMKMMKKMILLKIKNV